MQLSREPAEVMGVALRNPLSAFQVRAWTCTPCVGSGLQLDVIDFFYAKQTDTNGYVGVDHANNRIIVAFMGMDGTWQLIPRPCAHHHHTTITPTHSLTLIFPRRLARHQTGKRS
jgi:hypothetical protein